jgi:hypothetical protein
MVVWSTKIAMRAGKKRRVGGKTNQSRRLEPRFKISRVFVDLMVRTEYHSPCAGVDFYAMMFQTGSEYHVLGTVPGTGVDFYSAMFQQRSEY